jgi:hypothetical protein
MNMGSCLWFGQQSHRMSSCGPQLLRLEGVQFVNMVYRETQSCDGTKRDNPLMYFWNPPTA